MSSAGIQPRKSKPATQGLSLIASPQNRVYVSLLVLLLATLALYNRVSHYPFANFDDDRYLTDNAHVRAGLHWESIKWAFTTYAFNWHPVTWLSHMVDWQLFHANAGGHHYMNVLFHVLNVVLLFFVLKRATGYAWRSLTVAGLFALHPINVESVVWIAERKNLLSMMFFLLALGAYQWYARRPELRRYAVVTTCFALGLMAKAQIITFPFVLLLWDYWPLRRIKTATDAGAASAQPPRSFSWLAAEKLPLLALSAADAVLTVEAQKAVDAIGSIVRYPLLTRLENALISYARYIGKALWPAHLAPMYPFPANGVQLGQLGAALSLLIILTAVAVIGGKRRRYLLVGWLWFLGTLVPMIGLVQIGSQAMADRYAYLSFLGLFIMVCWSVADWVHTRRLSTTWLAGASVAALLACAVVTWHQVNYWSDNAVLWTHALQVSNDNFFAEDCLGGALLAKGELEEATAHFGRAATLYPSDPISNLNLGFYEQQHHNAQAALQRYEKVTQVTQDERARAAAFNNMGFIYRDLGQLPQARDSFQAALKLRPRNIRAQVGLGLVAQRLGNSDLAVQAYSDAIAIQPSDVLYVLLARALQQSGRMPEAQAALEKGRRMSQDFAAAQRIADGLAASAPSRASH